MTTEQAQETFIYLAPIRGLTDALFREVLFHHFQGYDAAIAPFINPQGATSQDGILLRDVLPDNNKGQTIVPQLLNTDPAHFLQLANRLADMGYTRINWNLGCPAPMVAKKKRGSGLLPYPDEIIGLLDYVMPKLTIQLSIKTRLGFFDQGEILHLLPRLNDYPLEEIILHTRLGKQLYKGSTNPDGFRKCLEISKHPLTYNGDVNDMKIYKDLKGQFQQTCRWMLGRGAVGNPLLAEEIKGINSDSADEKILRLKNYHDDLVERYSERLSGPSHILGRMKQVWTQMIRTFPGKEKQLKKILKSRTMDKYEAAVEQIFS